MVKNSDISDGAQPPEAAPLYSKPYSVRALRTGQDTAFLLKPDAAACGKIAKAFALLALSKLRFEGVIRPFGKRDWEVIGTLGATVEQPCVVTLAPVRTRIDESITRRFVWHAPQDHAAIETEGSEIEMDSDDALEPLGAEIDAGKIMCEALALALPLYPRAKDADTNTAHQVAPKGVTPLQDADLNPFAALGALRSTLSDAAPEAAPVTGPVAGPVAGPETGPVTGPPKDAPETKPEEAANKTHNSGDTRRDT